MDHAELSGEMPPKTKQLHLIDPVKDIDHHLPMTLPIYQREAALRMAARFFRKGYPESIGIAYMELNCGCIKICGVTAEGSTLGSLNLALSRSSRKKDSPPACKACVKDNGISIKRLLNHGIIWSATETTLPMGNQRLEIGQKIFGSRYTARHDTVIDID